MKLPAYFFGVACLIIIGSDNAPSPVVSFVGSTPADPSVRQSLKIPQDLKCDFIKWKLYFNKPALNQFTLEVNYGEGQPNTPGFWNGGKFATFTGTYATEKFNAGTHDRILYKLTGDLAAPLLLIRIDDNLLHILSPQKKVLIGGSGWSYTLSRTGEGKLNAISNNFPIEKDTARKIIYHGRTPCQEIVQALGVKNATDCRKLKWSITLKRDPVSLAPSGYILRGTLIRQYIDPKDSLLGNWSILKGTSSHPEATIYKLDITATKSSLYLMNIDNSLVLFLNEKKEILNGDKDFSYTINRKPQ